MKNAKKVFAMLIVLALAISMAIPVSAEVGTGTINITQAKAGEFYEVYQMAVLDFVEGESNTDADDLYAYYVEDTTGTGWYEFFASPSQSSIFTLTQANTNQSRYYIGLATGATIDEAQLAKDAIAFANANTIAPTATGTASTATLSFENLPFGYYAVDTTTGTVCSLNSLTSSVNIADKNDIPQVDKKIDKVGDRNIADDAADVKIGDIVEYSITIPYARGAQNYIVTDILSEGLTLVANNKTTEWSSTTNITDYTEWFVISNSGTPVSVDSSNADTKITAENGKTKIVLVLSGEESATSEITIKYSAKVNNKAIVENNGKNEVTLKYGEESTFTTDTVEVFPLGFSIKKVDSKNASKLLNAEFQIYKGNTLLKFEKIGGAYVYKENGPEDTLKTSDGLYYIKGLDAGAYTIKETKAPAGYNLPAGTFSVTITADKDNETITADYGTTADTNGVLTIENSTGAVLPSTGATGTIIFITVGGLMVVAMGVLLVVRKRMSKVVYTR